MTARCVLCGRASPGPRLTAGRTLQDVHQVCFDAWDCAAEAAELGLAVVASRLELLSELELVARGPRRGPQRAEPAPARRAPRRAA